MSGIAQFIATYGIAASLLLWLDKINLLLLSMLCRCTLPNLDAIVRTIITTNYGFITYSRLA
jgi:hypothetical protein